MNNIINEIKEHNIGYWVATGIIVYTPIPVNFYIVKEKVCEYFKVDPFDIEIKSRKSNLVRARQMIAHIMLTETNITLSDLGHKLGRDHSTMIHSRDIMEFRTKYETSTKIDYYECRKLIGLN